MKQAAPLILNPPPPKKLHGYVAQKLDHVYYHEDYTTRSRARSQLVACKSPSPPWRRLRSPASRTPSLPGRDQPGSPGKPRPPSQCSPGSPSEEQPRTRGHSGCRPSSTSPRLPSPPAGQEPSPPSEELPSIASRQTSAPFEPENEKVRKNSALSANSPSPPPGYPRPCPPTQPCPSAPSLSKPWQNLLKFSEKYTDSAIARNAAQRSLKNSEADTLI